MVNALITRLRDRRAAGWVSALNDVAIVFSSSPDRVRKYVLSKATSEEKQTLIGLGAPLAMEEEYQDGSNSRFQSGGSGRMQSDTTAPKAPVAPNAPSAPTAPNAQGSAAAKLAAKPTKPISKDQMSKAQKLATTISAQGDVKDAKTLSTKVGQQIGSVGGSQGDVGMMTGLVQAQLAAQGMDVKEDAIPQRRPTRWETLLDQPQIERAFEKMVDACGYHETQFNSIYRAICRDGTFERPLSRAQALWMPEAWEKVHAACLPHFDVRPAGEGDVRSIVITLIA